MPRKSRNQTKPNNVEESANAENIHEKQKKVISPKILSDITLTEKQNQLVDIIDKNKITIILGPAGCLTKNSNIWIYTMKSKNKKHSIIYEKSNS